MRNAPALGNHTRAVVGDKKVVGKHQAANHTTELSVVIDLFKGRSAVSGVKQQLIELRRVLLHHGGDLVVHEILYTGSLLHLIEGFLA